LKWGILHPKRAGYGTLDLYSEMFTVSVKWRVKSAEASFGFGLVATYAATCGGIRQASTPRMSIGRNNVGRLQFSSASHLVVCHIHDIRDRSIARFSTPHLFNSSCLRSNDRQIIINTELADDFATPVIPDTSLYIACPCDRHSAFMNMHWVRPSTALTHCKGMGIIPCAGISC
jgi:hypothetical protein